MIPWHALALLLLQWALRAFQIIWLAGQHALPGQVWRHLPWLLWPDLFTALLGGLVWDWALPRLGARVNPLARKTLNALSRTVFGLLLLYLGFSFKFYALFGAFFNYGYWTQVDRLNGYWDNLAAELNATTLAGLAGLLGIAWVLARLPRVSAGLRPAWALPAGTGVLLLILMPAWHSLPQGTDWRSLDKHPFEELASFFTPEPSFRAGRSKASGPEPDLSRAAQTLTPEFVRTLPLSARRELNVVFLVLESTTPEYAGLTTPAFRKALPNLTRLFSESQVFINHYCQEPATLKSLYTILTGRFSYATRRWRPFIQRARTDLSLPEILKPLGYASLFLTSANGLTYSQNEFLKGRFDTVLDYAILKKRYPGWADFSDCMDDRVLVPALNDALDGLGTKKFFIMICPYFPHHPYQIPGPEFSITPGKTPFERYQSSLHFEDFLVGELMKTLEQRHLAENTLVVLLSDHGEAFNQHPGNRLHSIFLYEENVRTLFALKNPRLIRPGQSLEITRHLDVAPTVLGLLGYPIPAADGVNLAAPHPAQTAYFYTTFSDPRFGARDEARKYIINMQYHREELFDLKSDPQETQNLAAANPEECRRCLAKLLRLQKKIQ